MRREEGGGVGGHCNWDTWITTFIFLSLFLFSFFSSRAALLSWLSCFFSVLQIKHIP